jgi:hypothetical protein
MTNTQSLTQKHDSLGGGSELLISRLRTYLPVKGNFTSAHTVVVGCLVLALFRFASVNYCLPIAVASQSKAWGYGRSLDGIAGSNPGGCMDICLL